MEENLDNQPNFSEEETIESLEVTKEEMANFLGEGDQFSEDLGDLVEMADLTKIEQNGGALEAQPPSLDYGTTNIMEELHNAEKQAQQEYTPLSGQTPPIQPPTQIPQSNLGATSEQPLQQPQYSQPANPTQTSQQGQQYPQQNTVSGQTPYNQGQQGGSPYQGAPEYQDHSVFYQNQSGQQQGQQGQQEQYSNQYNQQQYTQQQGQPQQSYQPPSQGYYQNNQYYPNPQAQKSSADGMAIASLVLGIFSVVGNVAMEMFGLSFICGVVGLILGITSRNKNKSTMSLIGIILNAVGIAITLIMMVACLACLSSILKYGYDGGVNPWYSF